MEIKLLEQRVLHLMRSAGTAPSASRAKAAAPGREQAQTAAPAAAAAAELGDPTVGDSGSGGALLVGGSITAVSEIQAVCSSDGIAAALREANLERLAREQVPLSLSFCSWGACSAAAFSLACQ